MNPHAILMYGDHKQSPPYDEVSAGDSILFKSDYFNHPVLKSPPIYYAGLLSAAKILKGKMRMPECFSNLFGSFFYSEVHKQCSLHFDRPIIVSGSGEFGNYEMAYSKHYFLNFVRKTKVDIKYVQGESSPYVIDPEAAIDMILLANLCGGNVGLIVPFLGQQMLLTGKYRESKPLMNAIVADHAMPDLIEGFTAKTIRTCQGDTYHYSYLDLVKQTNFLSITNSDAIVALSRHTTLLTIITCPTYDAHWFAKAFVFNQHATISDNFNAFLKCLNDHVYYVFPTDHVGMSPFRWRFFIWCLELVCFQDKSCVFEKLANLNPIRVFNLDNFLGQLGSDLRRFLAFKRMSSVPKDRHFMKGLTRDSFDEPKWYDRLVLEHPEISNWV
jgi:hypothetical protein